MHLERPLIQGFASLAALPQHQLATHRNHRETESETANFESCTSAGVLHRRCAMGPQPLTVRGSINVGSHWQSPVFPSIKISFD